MMLCIAAAILLLSSLSANPQAGNVVAGTCRQPGHVALTFDGGPGAPTGKVLDVLQRRKLLAAFHVNVDALRDQTLRAYVRRAAMEGHTVGIFVPDASLANAAVEEEALADESLLFQHVSKAANWLMVLTGRSPQYLRFGGKRLQGSSHLPLAWKRLLDAVGMQATRAKADIRDESNKLDSIWNGLSKAFASSSPAHNSFVVKMRDSMSVTAQSLERILDYIEGSGYTIVPLEVCVPLPERLQARHGAAKQRATMKASANSAASMHPSLVAMLLVIGALWGQ